MVCVCLLKCCNGMCGLNCGRSVCINGENGVCIKLEEWGLCINLC